ncbi:Uncharacterized protein AXF42_Ash017584 [Apostasia shenzhenica]|uniref:O-fucosyltransferase family protein n=1 Tax=Apostasia shenzhenica TaxID=1088818 RepID=A0A2I0A586_9ASPA|nr:Uncharacterized protein AXF42_Ash017584 [Apostasia shenzhenica]
MLPPPQRSRLQVWFVRVCSCVLVWSCLAQLVAVSDLWQTPSRLPFPLSFFFSLNNDATRLSLSLRASHYHDPPPDPSAYVPSRVYKSNGYLRVSCNGGLNQMRSAICDMVTVAHMLNLTLVVPELDHRSFWADTSNFGDIFDINHFIRTLKDEVHIVKRVPKRFSRKAFDNILKMPPISWSNENYYLNQILPLYSKFNVIHFNKTDARLSNNGLPLEFQRLRCRVNYQALKFTPKIEALGNKLIEILKEKGSFVALHMRYEMDMLAFSGCTHGCSVTEAEELKRMRYAYPWWREKEIDSKTKRLQGLCPLTPEETSLVLQALGFDKSTQIYIASGEIYGSEHRLLALQAAFPHLVRKEMLLDGEDLRQFRNHSSQMAALDYMVSISSDIFIPTYDGNMAKVVEGHRRYLGFLKTITLDRRKIVELVDLHENKTLSWAEFAGAIKEIHKDRIGQARCRKVVVDKPKEEDYFYSNPYECLVNSTRCQESSSSSPALT